MVNKVDIKAELANQDAQRVLDHTIRAPVIDILVREVLYGLGVIDTPDSLIRRAVETGLPAFGYNLEEVTLDFLRTLPETCFGQQVVVQEKAPFSLYREGDDIYIRCHMSRQEFESRERSK